MRPVTYLTATAVLAALASPALAQQLPDPIGSLRSIVQKKKREIVPDPVSPAGPVRRGPQTSDKLPPDPFSKPSFKVPDAALSDAKILAAIRRDFPGVVEVKKMVIERRAGGLWNEGTNSDGSHGDLFAGIDVSLYFLSTEGKCIASPRGTVVMRPYLGYGRYGEIKVDSNALAEEVVVPCNL